MAYKVNGNADSGVEMVKTFCETINIHKNELNFFNGSGLSPQN